MRAEFGQNFAKLMHVRNSHQSLTSTIVVDDVANCQQERTLQCPRQNSYVPLRTTGNGQAWGIATGDYPELLAESGRNNALAAYLCSLSHALVHYWQWLETGAITERVVVVRAVNMVRKYARDVDAP